MKKANGEYKEIIVTAMEETGVSKRCFWGHEQAMRYINENAPMTVSGYYERDPSHYTREQYPELYDYKTATTKEHQATCHDVLVSLIRKRNEYTKAIVEIEKELIDDFRVNQ